MGMNTEKKIFLSSPHMCGEEMKYIIEAFDTNWIAPLGANVEGFEQEIAEYVGAKHAVALSAGTHAIHLALKWLGVEQGDCVFCSSLTFSGSCNSIMYEKAIPVFIDSDYETWNMSPTALRKAFQEYPNPKAVIVVNLYGQSADYDEIRLVCNEFNAPIIEDAAESLGATYKGKKSGTLGDISICSFNGNKIITTSGGGMLVTNDEEAAKKVKFWATQSRDLATHYQHTEVGYNYRMSNICAGIGRGQLKALDERIAKKAYIYNYYKNALEEQNVIEFMPIANYGTTNHWLTCMTLKGDTAITPIDILKALDNENIEARPIWKPMHLQPVFAEYPFYSNADGMSIAEDIFNRGLCLPSDTKMTDEDLERVTEIIKGLFI